MGPGGLRLSGVDAIGGPAPIVIEIVIEMCRRGARPATLSFFGRPSPSIAAHAAGRVERYSIGGVTMIVALPDLTALIF
jgi:hypothetical protein